MFVPRLSLGHLGFKAFYVSPKLARRTYSLPVHRTLRGAAIPLHAHRSVVGRYKLFLFQFTQDKLLQCFLIRQGEHVGRDEQIIIHSS